MPQVVEAEVLDARALLGQPQAVELCWMRLPAKVKHQRACCPRVVFSAATASAFKGMPRPSPDFVVP